MAVGEGAEAVIGLEQVSAGYGEKTVLQNCSLTLAPRGITVLSGPSGKGKTTVLRLLTGLERPRSGKVYPAKQPAILFQENRLFPKRTVEQHLQDVLPHDRWKEVPEWLELAGMTGEEHTLPEQLSGGMARRLALVRAMALGGDCLFLDEPFTGVDAERKAILLQKLQDWPVPVLLITHHPDEMAGAEKILCLDKKILDKGRRQAYNEQKLNMENQ